MQNVCSWSNILNVNVTLPVFLSFCAAGRLCKENVQCKVSCFLEFPVNGTWVMLSKANPHPVSTLRLQVGTCASSPSFPWVSICTNQSDHLSKDGYSKRSMRCLRSKVMIRNGKASLHPDLQGYDQCDICWPSLMRTDDGADCDSSRLQIQSDKQEE